MSFFQELKRRNVIRVGIAYAVTSWLIVQVSDVVIDNIGAPDWLFKAILLVLSIGFPLAMIFAWAFELTPEGIKKEKDVDRTQSITSHTGRKLNFAIIGLLVLGLGYFIWESRFSGSTPNVPPATATTAEPTAAPVGGRSAADSRAERAPTYGESANPTVGGRSAAESPAAVTLNRKSIAVLPFSTRSKVEDDQFFSDGMHDDLLTQLAKIGELKVISRTSVMEYRNTTKNLRQIGAELGVAAILEGAIQRSGDQVRINVQLIDAQTDEHLWAENYDRELTTENLFAIQTGIAKAIAAALQATLSPEEEQRIEQRTLTDNLEALKAYQRARLLITSRDRDGLTRAAQEARNALELDPEFAAAWALLARSQIAMFWAVEIKPEYLETARTSIDKGRSFEPELPELDIAEGYYHYWGFRDYENALRVLTPVLQTYPNDAELHELLGYINRRYGRFDEALGHLHKALTLEPRSVNVAVSLAETYTGLRDGQSAKLYLQGVEDIDPSHSLFYYQAGNFSYVIDGDPAAALRYWQVTQHDLPYENWLGLAAMGKPLDFSDFDDFNKVPVLGEMRYTPALMRGLTLRLSGDAAAAQPWLDEARAYYTDLLAGRPEDFRLLKPLCLAEGARLDAAAAAETCQRALGHLPMDAWDRPVHREDIAGGLVLAGLNQPALDLVEALLSERVGSTRTAMQLNPFLRGLHEEPRWQALMTEPAGQ